MSYIQIKMIKDRIQASSIASRFVSGLFWSIIGNGLGKSIILLGFIIVANIIGKEAYGEFGMIRSSILMFSVFASVGMGLTASRYLALYRNTNSEKAYEVYLLSNYFSMIMGLLIACLLCIFAPLIAQHSLHAPHLVNTIRIGAIALFFITLTGTQSGILQGFEKFKINSINTLISGIFQVLFLALGAYFWGVFGAVVGMGISSFILYIINAYSIQKVILPKVINRARTKMISKETRSILWKFSLPTVMSSLLVTPVIWWSKTFVIQNAGFEAMANYDVAEQWNIIVLFIPGAIGTIILPMLSNIIAEGTNSQYLKVIKLNIIINAVITTAITLLICLCAPLILQAYGPSYNDKITFYIILASTIPNAIAGVIGYIIASKGRMWAGFFLNLLWGIWVILFATFFVGKMYLGAQGLALAILCAYILHVLFSYLYMWSKIKNANVHEF